MKLNNYYSKFSSVYGISLWIPSTQLYKKAKLTHNDCFKAIFKIRGQHSISEEFVCNRVNTLDAVRKFSIHSLMCRIHESENEFVSAVRHCQAYYNSNLYKTWLNLIH